MYTIDDLNVRLLSELKEIAEEMGVKNAKKLSKQDIIYKILDQQAVSGEAAAEKKSAPSTSVSEAEPERKLRPRRRENVAPAAPAPKNDADFSSDEILDSIDINFDTPSTSFNGSDSDSESPNVVEEQARPGKSEFPCRTPGACSARG